MKEDPFTKLMQENSFTINLRTTIIIVKEGERYAFRSTTKDTIRPWDREKIQYLKSIEKLMDETNLSWLTLDAGETLFHCVSNPIKDIVSVLVEEIQEHHIQNFLYDLFPCEEVDIYTCMYWQRADHDYSTYTGTTKNTVKLSKEETDHIRGIIHSTFLED